MQQPPEAVDISEEQYSQLLKRVEGKNLSEEDWKWVFLILRAYGLVAQTLKNQKVSIQKLKRLIFGKKTEKDKGNRPPPPPRSDDPGPQPQDIDGSIAPLPPVTESHPSQESPQHSNGPTQDTSSEKTSPQPNPKPKAPGHGRRGSDSWKNATVIVHPHTTLTPGCSCPKCKTGKLYPYEEPAVWVRFVGQPPLVVEVNQLERLRCSPCGELFTAPPPKELCQNPIATPEARATAAILKYHAATPFNRIAEIEASFGYPIPRTRIWTMCLELAESVKPVLVALLEFAAQGHLVQNDDTTVRILQLIQENKAAEKSGSSLRRKGMYTTAIVSRVGEHKVCLFFSSRKHAGENLEAVLNLRDPTLPPPTQVCDASSMNTSPGTKPTDVGGCHDHSRRNFFEIRESFPRSCGYALDEWKLIYETDDQAKRDHLNDIERLRLHQKNSTPVMERLNKWCTSMIDEKRVEPNGHLAGAMQYFLDHYSELTLFLRKPGVPISNCDCEQTLKTAIGVRKMAYFFKTLNGAKVGDAMFSLIATCKAAKVGLYEYLVTLQKNERKVVKAPELWFPWNYQTQLK